MKQSRGSPGPMPMVELSAVIGALILAFAPIPATVIERDYSTGVYPALQRTITPLSNRVPFALFDLLLVCVAVVVIGVLALAIREWWRTRAAWRLVRTLAHLAAAGAAGYILFLLV